MEVQYDLEDHNTQWPNIIFGEFYENDLTTLDKNEHFYNFERLHFPKVQFVYVRSNSKLHFEDLANKRFTGFRIKWKYCCSGNSTKKMTYNSDNKNFIKMANLVHTLKLSEFELMNLVRAAKVEKKAVIDDLMSLNQLEEIFKTVGDKLNESVYNAEEPLYENKISDQSLEIAAKMFIYIMAPQGQYWKDWYNVYKYWLKNTSIRRLLGIPCIVD